MRSSFVPLSAAVVSAFLAAPALATVLTFDFGGVNSDSIPPGYGNRVASFAPGPFNYGSDGGITPNVSVVFTPVLRLGGATPADQTRVFGDLNNVIYRDRNGGFAPGILEITLSADAGFEVFLHYFDAAAVFNAVTGVGEDLPARSIQVLDAQNSPLFQLDYDPNNPPSTIIPGTNVPNLRHRRFDFSAAPLHSSRLMIRLDLTQLITLGGSKVDRIGIDNIKFSQSPAPGAAAPFLGAAGLLLARRRR